MVGPNSDDQSASYLRLYSKKHEKQEKKLSEIHADATRRYEFSSSLLLLLSFSLVFLLFSSNFQPTVQHELMPPPSRSTNDAKVKPIRSTEISLRSSQ